MKALLLCLDDLPPNRAISALQPHLRRFTCAVNLGADSPAALDGLPATDDPAEDDVLDVLASAIKPERLADWLSLSTEERQAQIDVQWWASAVDIDLAIRTLRADPQFIVLRDLFAARVPGQPDPRITAAWTGRNGTRDDTPPPIACPPALAAIVALRWPAGLKFPDIESDEDPAPTEWLCATLPKRFKFTRSERHLVIAHVPGGHLTVRTDDADPADPIVFLVDNEDPKEAPTALCTYAWMAARLS